MANMHEKKVHIHSETKSMHIDGRHARDKKYKQVHYVSEKEPSGSILVLASCFQLHKYLQRQAGSQDAFQELVLHDTPLLPRLNGPVFDEGGASLRANETVDRGNESFD